MTHPILLESSFRESALQVAKTVADRLLDSEILSQGMRKTSHCWWSSIDHSFLAVLCGMLEDAFPGNAFELMAHHQLAFAVQNNLHVRSVALFGGLTQIGMAARFLNTRTGRYAKLLSNIDITVNKEATLMAQSVRDAVNNRCLTFAHYDIVSGLAGIAVYLVSRAADGHPQSSLESVLQSLIFLSEHDTNSLLHLRTPKGFVSGFLAGRPIAYDAMVNCGLAHGLPGVLAVLSLAHTSGISTTGLKESVQRLLRWLTEHTLSDEWGRSWPDAIAINSNNEYFKPSGITMDAWCYGSIGTARTVFLAGRSLSDTQAELLATKVLQDAILGRSIARHDGLSPTICHGLSGMLLSSYRSWQDTGSVVLRAATEHLFRVLIAKYDPSSVFGFRDLNNSGIEVDDPSFLSGACGIAIVLLTLATDSGHSPSWDRMLLLS